MKRLISPPIQLLLWLGGIACLALATLSILQMRLVDEQQASADSVSVKIPDGTALEVPAVDTYRRLVEVPLFWEARAVPPVEVAPPVVVAETEPEAPPPEPPPPPLNPPQGRLVGIVDLGTKFYALIRGEEKSQSIYKGDKWDGWTVDKITAEKVVLVSGEQKQEVKLIGEFAAPAENQQLAGNRKKKQQREALAARQLALQQAQAEQSRLAQQQPGVPTPPPQPVGMIPVLEPAAAPVSEAAGQEQPSPVMSIKEALEARQRLMASRWGAQNQPAAPPAQ